MKRFSYIGIFMFAFLLVILIPQPAMAYVGPGTGLAALGAFIAIVAGVIAAIFGFLWYPIKRLLRQRKQSRQNQTKEGEDE